MSKYVYIKNPDAPNCCINGQHVMADTVLTGPQWERYTRTDIPGRPPFLVKVLASEVKAKTPLVSSAKDLGQSATVSSNLDFGMDSGVVLSSNKDLSASAQAESDDTKDDTAVDSVEHEEGGQDLSMVDALTEVRGIDVDRARILVEAGYKTIEDIANADVEAMVDLLEISERAAGRLIRSAKRLTE